MEMSSRGELIQSTVQYVEKRLSPAERDAVYARLSPDVRDGLATLNKSAWYPRKYTEELWGAIGKRFADPKQQIDELVTVGHFVGDTAASTFLRLLLKLLTPQVFGRKFGEFWNRYQNFGVCEADPSMVDQKRMDIATRGIDGYENFTPVGAGWILHAFEGMGKKDVRLLNHDELTLPGPKDFVFRVRWS